MGIAPEALRELVVTTLGQAAGHIDVLVTEPLKLRLLHPNGRTDDVDLHLLSEQIRQDSDGGPTDIDEHVQDYVQALLAQVAPSNRTMIVLIRTRAQVEQIKRTTANVADLPLVGDLHAIVAWDGSAAFDFDMGGDVPEEALMEALNNVLSRVEGLTLHGEDPFLLAVGGRFEASLLLAGQVWDDLATRVQGDLVLAVPAHDVLLVSGTGDPARYGRFKDTVAQAWENAPADRLCSQILRWGSGTWYVHDEAALATA